MARRSTRLSSRSSSTPKRVSLSHDAPTKTPKTAPVKLSALDENDEMPGAFPRSASPADRGTPSAAPKATAKMPVQFNHKTPEKTTPLRPASDEMHPAHHHQSTAKPLDEARWLGFANMAPHTEPPKQASKLATLQATPTRTSNVRPDVTSSQYQFTFHREHSLELSPEAKKLMYEKREEAVRIREQMTAAGEDRDDVETAVARKIATPKGKSSRFSQAHLDQFQKMDSIAGHASAFRATPSWKKPSPAEPEKQNKALQSASKSLKRSPSKAQLDEPDRGIAHSLPRNPSKPMLSATGSSLPHATSSKSLIPPPESRETSPAKRVKRFPVDDATITRPWSSGSDQKQPATPSSMKQQPSYPDLTSLASPTQASLARAVSVKSAKSSKIPGPGLAHSPSKSKLTQDQQHSGVSASTPLLARSPAKVSPVKQPGVNITSQSHNTEPQSPLLVRCPLKAPLFKKQQHAADDYTEAAGTSLLARSPLKVSITKREDGTGAGIAPAQQASKEPLLTRSPMKMSVNKIADGSGSGDGRNSTQDETSNKAPLSRSPMKLSVQKPADITGSKETSTCVAPASKHVPANAAWDNLSTAAETPSKPANKSLMDRFNFLRSSPVKSILRSPQRLYSDDPAKVAAGTHLATPPKKRASEMNKKLAAAAKTAPVRKHVDFTSSTKARYERAQSEINNTPSKETVPASVDAAQASMPLIAQYPTLPPGDTDLSITPQKRRQTIAPGDFTFRAGPDGIVFGTSPNAPASLTSKRRPSTIRHVSAEPTFPASTAKKRKFQFENDKAAHEDNNAPAPVTTSKKRKFEFENEQTTEADASGAVSDKENADAADGEDGRPAKRVKQSVPMLEKKTKRPTLGVRPKGEVKGSRSASVGNNDGSAKAAGAYTKSNHAMKEKKSGTISQARLAALAQPKRRG